ncbi:MAG: hypothetical protein IT576_22005 [Verrucomicrobiales bacterium]|nr:hypothetical protein [Verrucomicrobiales bacterium]
MKSSAYLANRCSRASNSLSSGDLLDSASRSYNFGPSFRWGIFSAGRIRNEISAQ